VFRVGSTALVVKRKTRNNGNTRHTNLSYRVCSLCSSVPRRVALRTLCMDGEARGHHTARSLQLYDYRTCITQLASSISSSQSHRSSSHTRSCPTEPSGWPHAAVKQDCRKVTHTALVTMTTCQLHRRRESIHHAAQPLSTGWVHTITRGG
jgi:hypothetical protein